MAVLMLHANGNLSVAATWALVDPTSLLDSEAGSSVVATAPAWSDTQDFMPGAITIDGIAVKIYARAAAPTGTITCKLYNVTDVGDVAGTIVTVNVADMPSCSSGADGNEGGWFLFKFAAPVLLLAAKNYDVRSQVSVAGEVTLWRNGTANNFSRMLRTTTNQAPVAGDVMIAIGEHTGAGTGNNFTLTIDSVAATDYGTGVDGSTALAIGKRATVNYESIAGFNYILRLSGSLIGYNGGKLTIGDVGAEIPRDSSAVLEFDPVADGGMGLILRNGFTFTAQGLSRTIGKNFVSCKLNTDEAIGQTELGVDTDTGWLAGDVIGIASTSRTPGECEQRTIAAGGADVDHIDVTVGLANAHSGTAPTQAEIILLTRNVKIRSTSAAIMAYVNVKPGAISDEDWVEYYYMGEETPNKRGIDIQTTTGSYNSAFCSFHDFEDQGIYMSGTSLNNVTLSYCTAWSLASVSGYCTQVADATSGTWTIDHCVMIYSATALYGYVLMDVGGIFTNNTVVGIAAGTGSGVAINEANSLGTFTGIVVHSCTPNGFYIVAVTTGTITGIATWRNGTSGVTVGTTGTIIDLTLATVLTFGNVSYSITFETATSGRVRLQNVVAYGEAAYPTNYGFAPGAGKFFIENSSFSLHTAGDIRVVNEYKFFEVYMDNTSLLSVTPILNQATMSVVSRISSTRHNGLIGNHRSWTKYGTINSDQVYFHNKAPSEAVYPISATNKKEDGGKKRRVDINRTCEFWVWIRKSSVAAGGVNYNGNQPRLVLKASPALGVPNDVVLATMTAGLNVWERIHGTTPVAVDNGKFRAVVDCDGAAGFINVDDWKWRA